MRQLADYRKVITFDQNGTEKLALPDLVCEKVCWQDIPCDDPIGQDSYLKIMAPETRCNSHRNNHPKDCDGNFFRTGDFVLLSAGLAHLSVSHSGCKHVVTHRGTPDDLCLDKMEAIQ